jgi:hypothetical protein
MADPIFTKSSTDIDDPSLASPYIESAEPKRKNDLSEMDDPKCT